MAGIRTFNTNLPHVFRYPEWTSGIAYPRGSVVVVEEPDGNTVYNSYWVAIKDVTARLTTPRLNPDEWSLLFGDNSLDSDIVALFRDSELINKIRNFDSELKRVKTDLDSDRHDWQAADSDLRLNLDSERHDWKASDSDLGIRIDSDRHDFIARDSELKYFIDSELRIVRADADSDRLEGFDRDSDLRAEFDSEFRIVRAEADSDRLEGFDRDSDLRAEFDSEFRVVRVDMDSEYRARLDGDSDLAAAIDSERHDWKAGDSELRYYFDSEMAVLRKDIDSDRHYSKSVDSELYLRLDSELHDRKATDSDIHVRIDSEVHALENADSEIWHKLRDLDSEIAILFHRTDSDEDMLKELRAQIRDEIDSEIRIRLEADSDFDVIVKETIHNYLSNDSEIDSDVLEIKRRIDSEFDGAIRVNQFGPDFYDWGPQPFLTNTRYYRNTGTISNHTLGYLWLVDYNIDAVYLILNGRTLRTYHAPAGSANAVTTFLDSDLVEWRRGDIIEESPGDDADVAIYTTGSSFLPEATNANLYTVLQRYEAKAGHVEQVDLDTAFRRTVTTVVNMDSDLNAMMSQVSKLDLGYDSEINSLTKQVNDLEERVDSDLDVFAALLSNVDSDRHDFQAGDSDLHVKINKLVDSDIDTMKENIAELFRKADSEDRQKRDYDSDVFNGYTGISYRYIKQDHSAATVGASPVVNFDAGDPTIVTVTETRGSWIWNPVNERLVITDSEGVIVHNEYYGDEPILVEIDSELRARRGTDTGSNADIQQGGVSVGADDIWNFRFEYVHKFKRFGGAPEGYVLETIIDSEINLKQADSDNAAAMEFIGIWMRERDSDIKEEIHNRRRGDSDIIAEFRKPEEVLTLVANESDYILQNPFLNEITPWNFVTEIYSNGSIYRGISGDHFQVARKSDSETWILTVDGVDPIDYTTITAAGSAQFSGADTYIPWDDATPLIINPLSTDSVLEIMTQVNNAMLQIGVPTVFDPAVPSVRYPTEYRLEPDNVITPGNTTVTRNGISFTFNVDFAGNRDRYYYKEGDTITIRKK